ncbi:MAG: O-antigen ligase family protein [Patescibacteria group bacterium]
MEKTLKNIVIWGMFVLPFLPLLVTSSLFFPYISGKNFAFRMIMELVFFAWLSLAVMKEEYRPKWNWLLGVISIFTAVILLADIFSIYPYKSFWSNFERMEGFVTIAHLWAYFVVVTSMFTKELWNKFINTWLVSSALISIYAILQVMGVLAIHQSGTRVDATFGNATYLAVFALFNIFFCIYQYIKSEDKNYKIGYGALAMVLLFVLYNTATRGAILGLIGGVILTAVLIVLTAKENPKIRQTSFIVLGVVFVVLSIFLSLKNTSIVRESPVLGRFASISLEEATTKSRFLVWGMAMQGVKERPILGWGQESFNYVFNKYYDPQMYAQEQWFDRTHNVISDWLIAGGALGLLSYLSILFFAFFYIWKADIPNTEKSILTGLLAGYFAQNLFVFDQIISYLLFFSLLGYIHYMAPHKDVWQRRYDSGFIERIITPSAVVLFIFTFYFVNVGGIMQGRTFVRALDAQAGEFEKNLVLFKKALAYDAFGTSEVREYLAETTNSIRKSGAPDALKQDFFTLANSELDKQISETPQNARYYVFKGSLLTNFGQYKEALAYFDNALGLSPKKQYIYFSIGSLHILLNDYIKAEKILEEAFLFEPKSDSARMGYATGLIYNDKVDKAKEILVERFGYIPADERLIKAFFDTGRLDMALENTLQKIKEYPGDAQHYVSLAAVYSGLGDFSKAIKAIEKAIELNPGFKEQGEYYISQLRKGIKP